MPACLLARDVLLQKQPGDVSPGGEGEAAAEQVGDAGAGDASREVAVADEGPGGQAVAGEKVTAQGEKAAAHDGAVESWPSCWVSVECLAQMELHPAVGYRVPSARFHAMGLEIHPASPQTLDLGR